MMRSIRFRAWSEIYKSMYYDSNYLFETGGLEGHLTVRDKRIRELIIGNCTKLMQFTGLNDKNGKEIYEGDIVATGVSDEYVKSVVRIGMASTEGSDNCYAEEYYGVYLEGSAGLMDYLLRGEMYVVGNIYEHPELLEVKS